MLNIHRLYPQYNIQTDRRNYNDNNQSSPFQNDRRSGADRRSGDRIQLDTNLTRDIFEVKSKVNQLQNPQQVEKKTSKENAQYTSSNKIEKINFKQNVSKAAQNSIKTDTFIKSTKTPEPPKENENDSSSLASALGLVLGGTIAATCFGVAGVGVALGIGAYFGGKLLRSAVVSHLTSKHK